jgi:hypothetical protein
MIAGCEQQQRPHSKNRQRSFHMPSPCEDLTHRKRFLAGGLSGTEVDVNKCPLVHGPHDFIQLLPSYLKIVSAVMKALARSLTPIRV